MVSLNSSSLLHSFLFHLRTPLGSIRSALHVAKQWDEKIPANVLNWLEKWNPSVERWISAEENAHSFLRDEGEHDWEQLVYEMADDMKDISVAYAEGLSLEMPETPECKMIFNLTLGGGYKYLNGIIQPILDRDFSYLLR